MHFAVNCLCQEYFTILSQDAVKFIAQFFVDFYFMHDFSPAEGDEEGRMDLRQGLFPTWRQWIPLSSLSSPHTLAIYRPDQSLRQNQNHFNFTNNHII